MRLRPRPAHPARRIAVTSVAPARALAVSMHASAVQRLFLITARTPNSATGPRAARRRRVDRVSRCARRHPDDAVTGRTRHAANSPPTRQCDIPAGSASPALRAPPRSPDMDFQAAALSWLPVRRDWRSARHSCWPAVHQASARTAALGRDSPAGYPAQRHPAAVPAEVVQMCRPHPARRDIGFVPRLRAGWRAPLEAGVATENSRRVRVRRQLQRTPDAPYPQVRESVLELSPWCLPDVRMEHVPLCSSDCLTV